MKIQWRKSAIQSLIELDQWRETIELPSIAMFLKNAIELYFEKWDFSVCVPGRPV